jgi:anti-anti-sigma factor
VCHRPSGVVIPCSGGFESVDEVFGIDVNDDVISLSGDLDAHTAPQLDEAINELVSSGRSRIVLQMAEVGFVDSSGLRSMIRARNEGGGERDVIIQSPSAATMRLLEITGMTEHFVIEAAP